MEPRNAFGADRKSEYWLIKMFDCVLNPFSQKGIEMRLLLSLDLSFFFVGIKKCLKAIFILLSQHCHDFSLKDFSFTRHFIDNGELFAEI